MDLANYNFSKYHNREALALENKIVYFGREHVNSTFVLEREEEAEQLSVVGEEEGFFLKRREGNPASRVAKREKIYAFETWNYEEVRCYSLESGKWSLFCSQK